MSFLSEKVMVARAVLPILRGALMRGQLFRPACELTPADPDICCDYGVRIELEEGFAVTANVFRSKSAEGPVPVVMCAHPYDNRKIPALGHTPLGGAPIQYRLIGQHGRPRFSELTSWESPDPNFWVRSGYAVVNMNFPGYGDSEGPGTAFTDHQAKCFYEAIEWVARQPWCTGKVALSGVSFLAISQVHVAACRHYGQAPPSLACISPWEGLSDLLREVAMVGGVREVGFPYFWWELEMKDSLNGSKADFETLMGSLPVEWPDRHPFWDAFWDEKRACLERITVPTLVCGSFSDHLLHTTGSFDTFRRISSEHKWLYTHRTGKWDAYYSTEVQELTRRFFDCFCKGETDNGWMDTPRVRLEVRSALEQVHQVRGETDWPLPGTEYRDLHLVGDRLRREAPTKDEELSYDARNGSLTFVHTFAESTELTGHMVAHLWVEARSGGRGSPPDDMVVFVAVGKRDKAGRAMPFLGTVGSQNDRVTRGMLRVACRRLHPELSTSYQPVLAHEDEQLLSPGEVVGVQIGLFPSSTYFHAGESLELVVAGYELIKSPPFRKSNEPNHGVHVVHCGAEHPSRLVVPVIGAKG
jgi:uncharacterized protein